MDENTDLKNKTARRGEGVATLRPRLGKGLSSFLGLGVISAFLATDLESRIKSFKTSDESGMDLPYFDDPSSSLVIVRQSQAPQIRVSQCKYSIRTDCDRIPWVFAKNSNSRSK
jgi:hypothetical protein